MRTPDLIIGPRSNPQTHRWHLWLPSFLQRRGWQLALHRWYRSDDDRALHDHKAWSVSLVLWGGFLDWTSHSWETRRYRVCYPGAVVFRAATKPHRIVLRGGGRPVWSLWLRGKPIREWGFYCRHGWVPQDKYIAERDYKSAGSSTIGRGCD